MKVIFSSEQLAHESRNFLSTGATAPNPEQPERAEVLLQASRESGASKEVFPNVHPIGRTDDYPKSAVGQVGF